MRETSFHHPDRHALEDLDAVFSIRGGRLFRRLRDKEGMACAIAILRPPLDKKE